MNLFIGYALERFLTFFNYFLIYFHSRSKFVNFLIENVITLKFKYGESNRVIDGIYKRTLKNNSNKKLEIHTKLLLSILSSKQ